MVNDEGALRETIEKVIADNPQSVEDYHNGKKKAMGFLVGQTMKAKSTMVSRMVLVTASRFN